MKHPLKNSANLLHPPVESATSYLTYSVELPTSAMAKLLAYTIGQVSILNGGSTRQST